MPIDEETQPLTPAVFHILLALADGPLHGYAIMKRAESDSGIKMGPGTVYGSIRRLQDAGWVVEDATSVDAGDGRRGRAFGLSPQGSHHLEAEARRITRLAGMDGVRRLVPDSGTP